MICCESLLALRAALYRRAVACAWLALSNHQERYSGLTLAELEDAIAASWKGSICASMGSKEGWKLPARCFRI